MGGQSKLVAHATRLAPAVRSAPRAVQAVVRIVPQAASLSTARCVTPKPRVSALAATSKPARHARALSTQAEHHGHNESLQAAVHKMSIEDPAGFWGQAALDIKWSKFPQKIYDGEDGGTEVCIGG